MGLIRGCGYRYENARNAGRLVGDTLLLIARNSGARHSSVKKIAKIRTNVNSQVSTLSTKLIEIKNMDDEKCKTYVEKKKPLIQTPKYVGRMKTLI